VVTRIDAGSAHHRGRGRERDYCADERTERGKPEICFHVNYLKRLRIDVSENFVSELKNRQDENGEQNSDQRARDNVPKKNTPA
jgi:hypothetical protein